MGFQFHFNPPVRFDDAVAKLQVSGRVIVEPPAHRVFLYGQRSIESLDRECHTSMGRISKKTVEADKHTDPDAMAFFYKCSGDGARKFLVMVGEIVGADVVTEYGDSVTDPKAWSVECYFGPEEEDEP